MKNKILSVAHKLGEYRKALQRTGIFIGGAIMFYQLIQCFVSVGSKKVQFYHPLFFIFPIVLFPLAAFQQMIAWKLIMKGLRIEVPVNSVVRSYAFSFLPRYIPGTIWGYLSRAEWLLQQHKVAFEDSNLGSLLEIEIAVLSCVLLVAFYGMQLISVEVVPISLALVLLVFVPWLLFLLIYKKYKNNQQYSEITVKPIAFWLLALILFVMNGFYNGIGLWAILQGLSLSLMPFSIYSCLAFAAFYALAWLVGFFIIFIPSGLGIREVLLTTLIATYIGVTLNQANASSVFMRLCILFSEILWVGFGFIIKNRSSLNHSQTIIPKDY